MLIRMMMMMAMTQQSVARFTFRLNVCARRLHARSPGQAADARTKTGEAATSRSHRQLRRAPACKSISALSDEEVGSVDAPYLRRERTANGRTTAMACVHERL